MNDQALTTMDFHALAASRCSTRSFTQDPIPQDSLNRILETARLAPSAKNLQPWRFIVIRTPEVLRTVHACYSRDWLQTAPAILVVTGRRCDAWVRASDGYNSLETDLSIAMDHIILAAENEGISTCWIAAFDLPCLRRALSLTGEDEVFAFTPLGYPAEGYTPVPKKRKPLEEIATYL
ncbi:nitroreductase family protein [Pelodictyon luteolum]|uniref:Nitroreductase family protein n=1 Tax=Chlorobium luteolum (strain DSM 273 / BCRC 81028 / 2530) TaxID=319225 RepID=Q3B6R8_CHLL3|nr:nitroreductase family protein [Pelodictyon luteolum]ABB22963.1 nitroreductase family protein [Pelodictyon luteolum DSM 273]